MAAKPALFSSQDSGFPRIPAPPNDVEIEIPHPREFPQLQLAYQTFLNDLPELLEHYPDQFVAYQGNVRLGICESPWGLEAKVGTLPAGTAAVFTIQPDEDPSEDRSPAFL
jgi:hypothetical protein